MIGRIFKLATLCSIVFSMNAFAYKAESKLGPYAVSIESKIFNDLKREERLSMPIFIIQMLIKNSQLYASCYL